jgi:hypothetical protein
MRRRSFLIFEKQKQKMILNDKQDCIEQFARILEQTSAWRRKTATKYPDDLRNLKAAEILDQLVIDSANLSGEQWEELKPHFGWSSQTFRDALIQATKLVGFTSCACMSFMKARSHTGTVRTVQK